MLTEPQRLEVKMAGVKCFVVLEGKVIVDGREVERGSFYAGQGNSLLTPESTQLGSEKRPRRK